MNIKIDYNPRFYKQNGRYYGDDGKIWFFKFYWKLIDLENNKQYWSTCPTPENITYTRHFWLDSEKCEIFNIRR